MKVELSERDLKYIRRLIKKDEDYINNKNHSYQEKVLRKLGTPVKDVSVWDLDKQFK